MESAATENTLTFKTLTTLRSLRTFILRPTVTSTAPPHESLLSPLDRIGLNTVIRVLASHWLFSQLPPASLSALANRFRSRFIPTSELIFRSPPSSSTTTTATTTTTAATTSTTSITTTTSSTTTSNNLELCIVLKGTVQVLNINDTTPIASLSTPAFFGPLHPFFAIPHDVEYRALDECTLAVLDRQSVDALMASSASGPLLASSMHYLAALATDLQTTLYRKLTQISVYSHEPTSKKKAEPYLEKVRTPIWDMIQKVDMQENDTLLLKYAADWTYYLAFGSFSLSEPCSTTTTTTTSNSTPDRILTYLHPSPLIYELRFYMEKYKYLQLRCTSTQALLFRISRKSLLATLQHHVDSKRRDLVEYRALYEFLRAHTTSSYRIHVAESRLAQIIDMSARLASTQLGRGMKPMNARYLAGNSFMRTFVRDQCVLAKSDAAGSLFVVLQGSVRVMHCASGPSSASPGSNATTTPLVLDKGEYFGEVSVMFGTRSVVSVWADAPKVTLMEIPRALLMEVLGLYPEVEARIRERAVKTLCSCSLSDADISAMSAVITDTAGTIRRTGGMEEGGGMKAACLVRLSTWAALKGSDQALLSAIARYATLRRLPKDTLILKQGEVGNKVYLITSGRVKACTSPPDSLTDSSTSSGKITHRVLKHGECFGELREKVHQPRKLAFIVAAGECELLEMSQEAIEVLQERLADVVERIYLQMDRMESSAIKSLKLDRATPKKAGVMTVSRNFLPPIPPVSLTGISGLNEDCLVHVFEMLHLHDQLTCRLVCRQWSHLLLGRLKITRLYMDRSFTLLKFEFVTRNAGRNLHDVHFDRSPINGTHLRLLARLCPNLTRLNVLECKLLAYDPSVPGFILNSFPFLRELTLPRKSVLKRGYPTVGVNDLVALNLVQVGILDPRDIQTMAKTSPMLRELSITRNDRLDDEFVKSMFGSDGFKFLQVLDLSGCVHLTDVSLRFIAMGAPNLKWLDISTCPLITDLGIFELSMGIQRFEYLDFSNLTQLTDACLAFFLDGIRDLRVLKMRYCFRITESLLRYIAVQCPKLMLLVLTGCKNLDRAHAGTIFSSPVNIVMHEIPIRTSALARAEQIAVHERYHMTENQIMRKMELPSVPDDVTMTA